MTSDSPRPYGPVAEPPSSAPPQALAAPPSPVPRAGDAERGPGAAGGSGAEDQRAVAVAHATARATGPLRLDGDAPAPAGMARLTRADEPPLALPVWPDGATPALLEEYQVAPVTVERSGEARRVLAACLKCCWTDLEAEPWPGEPAPVELVIAAYRELLGRSDDLMRNWAIGALRRLHESAWITMSAGTVRLGPRCALWPAESHAQLRELVRRLPSPAPPAVLPLPADTPSGGRGSVTVDRGLDDDILRAFDERRRAELVAAFMAVEHAAEPVHEARFAALRDPALRRALAWMLERRGRTLIQHRDRWTSGYDDAVAARIGTTLSEAERAVLTLVLVHSVAIPRAEGVLGEDTWLSPYPTPVEELRRHTQIAIGELEAALRSLRHAGLLTQIKSGEDAGGYVPGPQFHRLTRATRRRLQEELILAAGPNTPLAAAVRARRGARDGRARADTPDAHRAGAPSGARRPRGARTGSENTTNATTDRGEAR